MANVLMLAVAGAGKTTHLVNSLNENERFLIVTYTTNNVENIRRKIIRRFSYFPSNITLMSYYVFLYNICFLPYSKYELKPTGISWKQPGPEIRYLKSDNPFFYRTRDGLLYHNRIAKYCHDFHLDEIRRRIEKYFDHFYFDEVQDLAGQDFGFIHDLFPLRIDALLVGDFFQHTFETSRDGNKGGSLYDDYAKYLLNWSHIQVDTTTLAKSFRCTKQICTFVSESMGIAIDSHQEADSQIVVLESQEEADAILLDPRIMKLVYQTSYKYEFRAMNWGASKGLDDFEDVCVILNKTTFRNYKANTLQQLAASSRNKLYVACTRAHRHLYIMSDESAETYKRD